jgi:two-component system OmpR family response regulator
VQAAPYDAIGLDVMLPDLDGFEIVRRLRAKEVWTPVLMLTARDAITDSDDGLDPGADHYLTNPFAYNKWLASLRAAAKRRELCDRRDKHRADSLCAGLPATTASAED